MITMPPQVVRRPNGSFVVLNVDLERMTEVQRVALGVQVWGQVRDLLLTSGEYKPKDGFWGHGVGTVRDINKATAKAVNVSFSSLGLIRPRLQENSGVMEKAIAGEITSLIDIQRLLGMSVRVRLSEGAPSKASPDSVIFGRTDRDRFADAAEPFIRYLAAWEKQEFLFPHLNPKEAKRRLAVVEEMQRQLERVKEDLTMRSHVATTRVDS